MFKDRLSKNRDELNRLYMELYADDKKAKAAFEEFVGILENKDSERKSVLKEIDAEGAEWFLGQDVVGMMLYVDLFSGNLKGLLDKADYFDELGVNLVHLMPLLAPREGENDGGYAVRSYRDVDPRLGTMDDLKEVIDKYRSHGIRLCIDYVVNHTANDHEWAKKALLGEKKYQDYYMMYDTEDIPLKYSETVPEVFPKVAPGNFTYNEALNKWIFTSFYNFQWDLNYRNPYLLNEMVDTMLHLANLGVEMIRLDAIPFMWKEIGTTCRNHPTIHKILRIMHLAMKITAPSVLLLGEAIVEPHEIVKYFGTDDAPECAVMYNASRMVETWNTFASRDTRHLVWMKQHRKPVKGTWFNYLRCHDDIGWGLDNENLRGMGFDPYLHKQFLIASYLGSLPGSYSVGELYEFDPKTMDARNCGTMASLLGLEKAVENNDLYQKELAVKRMKLAGAFMVYSRGIPLIYSGDELGLLNDYSYLEDEKKAHDSRWLHRQNFKWDQYELTEECGTYQSEIFEDLKRHILIRKSLVSMRNDSYYRNIDLENSSVLLFQRSHEGEDVFFIANFTEHETRFDAGRIYPSYLRRPYVDILSGKRVDFTGGETVLGPFEFMLLR